jgi:hypothetical protein
MGDQFESMLVVALATLIEISFGLLVTVLLAKLLKSVLT